MRQVLEHQVLEDFHRCKVALGVDTDTFEHQTDLQAAVDIANTVVTLEKIIGISRESLTIASHAIQEQLRDP